MENKLGKGEIEVFIPGTMDFKDFEAKLITTSKPQYDMISINISLEFKKTIDITRDGLTSARLNGLELEELIKIDIQSMLKDALKEFE